MNTYKRSQYSLFDKALILSGIVCIILGYYYFASAPWRVADNRDHESFGTISEGSGSRKLENSLQWLEIFKRSELYYGDVIFANEKKDIEITLNDKVSKLVVPEESMVKITKDGEEFNLDVSKGAILIKTKNAKSINLRDKRGNIQKIAVSENADIKISADQSSVLIEALKGKASLKGKDGLATDKDKFLKIGLDGSRLMQKLSLVKDKVIDPVFTTRLEVVDKYKKLPYFELSTRDNFANISRLPISGGKVNVASLKMGTYYIREENTTGYDSFQIKASRSLDFKIEKAKQYFYKGKLPMHWKGRPELGYRIQVAVNGIELFNKVVKGNSLDYILEKEGQTIVTLTEQKYRRSEKQSLPVVFGKDIRILGLEDITERNKIYKNLKISNPREISYRVNVTSKKGEILINKVSQSESFKFRLKHPGVYRLKVLSTRDDVVYYDSELINKNQITRYMTKGRIITGAKLFNIDLRWRRQGTFPKNIDYILKMFSDKTEKNLLLEKKLKKNSYHFKHRNSGVIYWKVESSAPEFVEASPLYSLVLSKAAVPVIGAAPELALKYFAKNDCYRFQLPINKFAKRYEVNIYSTRTKVNNKFKKVDTLLLDTNRGCLKSQGVGKYFYKYRIEDKWGQKSKFSNAATILFPISPI